MFYITDILLCCLFIFCLCVSKLQFDIDARQKGSWKVREESLNDNRGVRTEATKENN